MKPRLTILLMALSLLIACSRDPKVVRDKYFQSAETYFKAAKYEEASMLSLGGADDSFIDAADDGEWLPIDIFAVDTVSVTSGLTVTGFLIVAHGLLI